MGQMETRLWKRWRPGSLTWTWRRTKMVPSIWHESLHRSCHCMVLVVASCFSEELLRFAGDSGHACTHCACALGFGFRTSRRWSCVGRCVKTSTHNAALLVGACFHLAPVCVCLP